MITDTNSEIEALKRQVFSLLLALIVVSGTVTTYLFYQSSAAGNELNNIRPQATQIINAFNQNQALMNSFISQLVEYGKAHPDFRPVLLKYGIVPTGTAPMAPAAAAPAAPKK
ncbi:MAG: hypothetical protein WCF18_08585 [Chthoniobacteraceae bacterium]